MKWLKRIFWSIIFFLILINLAIIFTGKTYLYKGIKETYLKGKTGPGIYDSLAFPVRTAIHSKSPDKWDKSNHAIEISESEKQLLKDYNTTSFLIVKDNEIKVEFYDFEHSRNTKSNTFSMAKSFVSLMIGIAIDEHKIKSFDAPITDYLPFRLENDEGVRIRDLLGMGSGLDWSESGSNPLSDNAEAYYTSDLTSLIKKKKFITKPGQKFEYKSGNTQLLGIILQNATGMHPTDYFEEKIWLKIGAENDFHWSLDNDKGIEKVFCCGYATTRDFAKMGQLILNKGKWGNEQIIKSETLKELITPYSKDISHYGLHFWIFNHPRYPAVYFRGILGQYIIVIPSINVVIVRTGLKREEVYSIPDDKKNDTEYVEKNKYKENHPSDLFDYFSILHRMVEDRLISTN